MQNSAYYMILFIYKVLGQAKLIYNGKKTSEWYFSKVQDNRYLLGRGIKNFLR